MTDSALPHTPPSLELDRVQALRARAGEMRLRLSGRWLGSQGAAADQDEELLVVNLEGRRHRFPADREDDRAPEPGPGRWSASFTVPTWAEPREEGQAALWIGDVVIPVPALRQIDERTSDPPQLRATPADTRSGLDAGASHRGMLETTLAELRGELGRLREAVHDQRREMETLRQDLAAADVSREAALSEAAGLRSEVQRIGSELAVGREQADAESGELGEATALLADARALAQELRAPPSDRNGGVI